jgi:tetratricopeptide (TPR) repeat protein
MLRAINPFRKKRTTRMDFHEDPSTTTNEADPEKANVHYNLGCTLHQDGRYLEAITCYKECIKWDHGHVDAFYNLASALQELNIALEAEKYYKKTLVLNPKHGMAHYNLGYLYQDAGKWSQCIECFEAAVALMPSDVDAYISLGLVYKEQKIFHDALQTYQKAVLVAPKSVMAHFNLANAQLDMKFYDEAVGSFQRVLALQPDHLDAWFNLAIAYQDRAARLLIPAAQGQNRAPSTPFCASERKPRPSQDQDQDGVTGAVRSLSADLRRSVTADFEMALRCYRRAGEHSDGDASLEQSACRAAALISAQLAVFQRGQAESGGGSAEQQTAPLSSAAAVSLALTPTKAQEQ